MAKSTRCGSLVLQCDNCGDSVADLQQKIQKNLGSKYLVKKPEMRNNRIKIYNIHENEHTESDNDLKHKIKLIRKMAK